MIDDLNLFHHGQALSQQEIAAIKRLRNGKPIGKLYSSTEADSNLEVYSIRPNRNIHTNVVEDLVLVRKEHTLEWKLVAITEEVVLNKFSTQQSESLLAY